MAAAPPRSVTKALLSAHRLVDMLTPQELRSLRDAPFLSIATIKCADDEDRSLRFGFGVRGLFSGMLKLSFMPWSRDMSSWSVNEWAWFLVLLMHQVRPV